MKNYKQNLLFVLMLFTLPFVNNCAQNKEVISKEALMKPDPRIRHSQFIDNQPTDGVDAEINPPRFRWYYYQDYLKLTTLWGGSSSALEDTLRPTTFRFQIADNKEFNNPAVNLDTEINFYNELAPLPEGKTYYWRVGYILYGETEPSSWTKTFSFNIPEGTPKWDRSALKNPNFNEHPRLLFKKDQLPQLREMALKNPIFTETIMSTAEEMLNNKWWNDWPKTDLDKPDYTYGFYFHLSRKLMQTAFAYLITEDERFSNIIDIWTTIATYPKGGASSPELMGVGADSEDNTSITEFMACVYDWFYHDLTEEQKKIFETSLEWRISEWMYNFTWGGALYVGGKENPGLTPSSLAISGTGHSWEGSLDTYPAAIAMYEKSESARKYFHWIGNYMIAVGESIAKNDGGYDLGAHYGQSHMKWLVYQLMYLSSAVPELQLGKNPLYKGYADFFIGMVPIGMKYSHFGRIGTHGAGMSQRKEIFGLLAYLLGDGEVLYNWKSTINSQLQNEYGANISRASFSRRQWIHVASPLLFKGKLEPVPSDKNRYLFPMTGYVMSHRYNPSKEKAFKEGVGVIFSSTPRRGDRYNNANAFQMYAYGQHLNFGGHSGDENPYGFQTISANTIMVDGIGQTITKEVKEKGYRAALMAYKEGHGYTYWVGDATNAYPRRPEIVTTEGDWMQRTQIDYDSTVWGDKGAPQLERFRRHMLFMRDKYLVVYDDLETKPERPSIFSWRYRILPDCDLNYNAADGLLSYTLDSVKVFVKQVAYSESIEFLDLKDLDQYKNPITGEDYMVKSKWVAEDMQKERYRRMVAQHNLWFTTKEPKSEHNFLTVVYPVEPGTADPVITRLDDKTVKVEKDGEVDIISFDKNTEHPATHVIDLEVFQQPIVFDDEK